MHQIAPFKKVSRGSMPPNPSIKARRKAPRNTSRKRDVCFSPIVSPSCLNMDVRPCSIPIHQQSYYYFVKEPC